MIDPTDIVSVIKDLDRRLTALESYNQFQKIVGKDNSGTPRILIDSVNGVIKISRAGFNVTTTANVNLAFNSNFSMFRETQLQCNSQQRFTDQSSYIELNDCQIQINFADWPDNNMYYECVMKTGAGTGFMRLWNMTDSTQLVEISTSSTTAISVRSSAITKPTTGIKNFRESQKITSGGGAFTDVYIGRVVMRYDF